jgi:hypothetical protein
VPEIQGGQFGDGPGHDAGTWYKHNDDALALRFWLTVAAV